MPKIIFILIFSLLILFGLILINPVTVYAAKVNPDPIGDIETGESREITVSELDPNQKYYWKESKLTGTFGGTSYTDVFSDCYTSDEEGTIKNTIGPYSRPGIYLMYIFKATSIPNECKPDTAAWANQYDPAYVYAPPGSNTIGAWEFSIGGRTDQSCCEFFGSTPIYDSNSDECKNSLDLPLTVQKRDTTTCEKQNPKTYCEPDSLKCFKTKTFMVNSKICLKPSDPRVLDNSYDKDKEMVCPLAGGKEVVGCSDKPDDPNPGIATAIGCIHTNPAAFAKDLLTWVIGIGGGLAFLMMLLGAFQMLTSSGNPETLNAGKERLTSAVIGLLFIIFSILLLQIIGAGILKIPGFGN